MKKIILIIAIGILTISVYAQKQQNRHEISIWGGGGISTFMYDLSLGDRTNGFGAIGGLGYNYFLGYHWSIGLGAEFSLLNAKMTLPSYFDTYDAPYGVSNADIYRFGFSGQSLEQSQGGYYINIPLQVKYQLDVFKNSDHKLYAAIGPKIGIPLKTFYSTKGDVRITGLDLDTRDSYGTEDNGDFFKTRGFGLFNYNEKDKDLNFDLNVIAAAEVGMKWCFNNSWALYTGVFFDYGLNDLRKDKAQQLFEYQPFSNPVQYASNSVLSSQYKTAVDANTKSFTDKVNTMAFGIKLQLAFGTSPFNKKVKEVIVIEEKPFEGVTADQMEEIIGRSTKDLIEFQRKEFDALKALLEKEDPELFYAIINFDLDKKEILSRMHSELDRKVELMKQYPKVRLMLEGHTDDYSSVEYNYQLGLDRAQAAKNYMVNKGINPSRLQVSSKGKSQPAVPNTDDVNRYRNRRVEFILIP